MVIECKYHPSRPQRLFHETKSDEVMYGGEVSGGKTKALIMEAMLKACKYPGVTIYLFRATYQQGEDTLLQEMERSYPPEIGKYVKLDQTFYVVNGSKIKMRQCKTLDDAKKNDGKEFSLLLIDEAQHLEHDAFDYLCTRPRANKDLGIQPQVKFTAMQGGKGHSWINRKYVKPLIANEPKQEIVTDSKTGEQYKVWRQFIPASLEDNFHVDRRYAARLAMRSDRLQKKVRSSDWNAVEGAAFPEWVDKPLDENGNPTDRWTHVIKPFEIPPNWPIYRGFDYGRSSPYSVLWFARGDERYKNRLFLIHELYGGTEDEEGLDEPVSVIADKIARIEAPLLQKHGMIDGVADPAIFSKSAFSEESIAAVMATPMRDEHGNIVRHAIDFRDPRHDPEAANNVINNRLLGKELIHQALVFDADGHPSIQVFETCKWFRKHFPELTRDAKNPDDVDSDKTADHDYDAFRYVIMLTKPKVKAPVDIRKYRPRNPLGFTPREDSDDYGKVLQIPEIIVGG